MYVSVCAARRYVLRFVTIFSYDLYDDSADDAHYGVGGWSGKLNMTVTTAERELVGAHSTPYANLVFADAALMVYTLSLEVQHEAATPGTWWLRMAKLLLIISVFAFFTNLSAYVYYKDATLTGDSTSSIILTITLWARYLYVTYWCAAGQLLYRMWQPSAWKVKVTFSCKQMDAGFSYINPDKVFEHGFRLFVLLIFLTFMYSSPEGQSGNELSSTAFTTVPGVLLFAPGICLMACIFGAGMALSYVRHDLFETASGWGIWRRRISGGLSVLFLINIPLCVWRMLPEVDWANYLDYPLIYLFLVWSLVSNSKTTRRCASWLPACTSS